jgi:hypothetical protein
LSDDDILDPGRIDAAALKDRLDHDGAQVPDRYRPQASTEAADRGAQRADDCNATHD